MEQPTCDRCLLNEVQAKQRGILGLVFIVLALLLPYFHPPDGWMKYTTGVPLFAGLLHLRQAQSKRCSLAAFTSQESKVRLKAIGDLLWTLAFTGTGLWILRMFSAVGPAS